VTPLQRLAAAGFKTALLEHIISRLDHLRDYSGFDTLLVNIHLALLAISRHLPALLPAPLVQSIPVLAAINVYIRRVGIGKIATTSDSGRDGVANTTFGKFRDRPLYAAYVEDAGGVPDELRERIFLCFGLLLLLRLGIQSASTPSTKEVGVADGLRKMLSKESWHPMRALLPEPCASFIQALQQLDRTERRFGALSQSQRDFIGALGVLGESWSKHSSRPTINRVDRSALDDDEIEEQGSIRCFRFELSGEEGDAAQEIEPIDQIEFFETSSTPVNGANKLQEHRLSVLAIHAVQRFCRDNQFLPNRWRALTEKEAAEFVSAARAELTAISDGSRKQAAIIASLVFITSQRPETIADFVIVEQIEPELLDTFMSEHIIDLGRKVWWHTWPALPGRFMPTPEQSASLIPNTDWIALPLPDDLCDALRGCTRYPSLLSECMGYSREGMERLHLDFCSSLRGGSNRTSPARVRAHGFDFMVRKTADDTFASGLQGTVEYAPYSPLYYYSFPVEEGVLAHTQRMQLVGWPVSTVVTSDAGLHFGSRLQPTNAAIRGLVDALRLRLEKARGENEKNRQPAALARVHNALAVYTLTMAIFATGHRRAREYSVCRWTLDIDRLNLMIADKIIGTANSIRSVALPAKAAAQIDAYLDHLGYLASRISRFNPELAASIRSLCQDSPANDALPMLFLLDEELNGYRALSHEVLQQTVGEVWPLPWHAARHQLEMDTRARNLSAEYNHYRAGHISTGQQPYSPVSPLVPERTIQISADVADRILQDYGWTLEPGLGGRLRAPGYFERKAASALANPYLPGPVAKAQSLAKMSNASVVMSAIDATKQQLGKQAGLNDEAVERIRQKIVEASSEHPFLVAERLNLLRKILKRGRNSGEFRLRNLPGIAAQYQELPSFMPDAAWRIRQGEALRQGFLDGVALNEARTFDDYLDRISFSLIAFSAFTDPATLVPALNACFSMAFSESGYFWIEFPRYAKRTDDGNVLSRRPLDPVTTCLVLAARAKHGTLLPQSHLLAEAVRRGLCRASELAMRYAEVPVEPVRSIEECCRAFVPYWRFRLPGIHAAWCEGRLPSASMPRPDFLRMLIGIRPAETGKIARSAEPVQIGIVNPEHHKLGFVKARQLMRRIGQILITAHSDSVSGGKEAKHYAFKLQLARKELAALQGRLDQAPLILQAIAAWLAHLMEEGGVSGKRLQASSVATYYWSIAYPLLEFFLEEDISALDEDALEDIYSQSLDSRSENTRIKRARVLRQFHGFCVARYGCPEVVWYEIEPMIDADRGCVDANIVTPHEYDLAVNALQSHVDAGNRHAFKLKALLVLMYRGGLRMGEAFRLTLDDFVFDGKVFIVFVRGNRYGKPKTANGRRQIHLGWRMPNEERELIIKLIESRRQLCGDAPETAFFGSTASPHRLDLRKSFERNLGALLRWATGRNTVRPHHLRHSMVSYCVASQFDLLPGLFITKSVSAYFCGVDDPGAQLRRELLGHPDPSRRVMHAVCAETGHGSPHTLLSVYANCLDISLAEQLWQTAPKSIGDSESKDGKGQSKKILPPSVNKYARPASLSGLNDARLRKMMHDGIDTTNPSILARHLLHKFPVAHDIERLDDQSSTEFVPDWEDSSQPSMEQLHGVLSAAAQGLEMQKIAAINLMTEEQVIRLVNSARRIHGSCRYDAYGLKGTAESWWESESGSKQSQTTKIPNMPEAKRGGDALERLQVALNNLEDPLVRDGLAAWARSYRPSVRGLVCNDPQDFKVFWSFLKRIGYEEKRIVVAVPMVTTDKRTAFRERLVGLGIPGKVIQPMGTSYLGGAKGGNPIVPALIIKRTESSTLKPASCPMTSIHQYCFLCFVALCSKGEPHFSVQ
jgi:site-specific recombinase XerD